MAMSKVHPKVPVADKNTVERRHLAIRRVQADKRGAVRFDDSGGDRRTGFARRRDDTGLHGWYSE
jgi:hypothetical protein